MASKLIFFGWISFSVVLALFLFLLGAASDKPAPVAVEILPGTGFKEIGTTLLKSGAIRSKSAFMIYGIFSGSAHKFKPGHYFLNAASSTPAIVGVLTRGPILEKSITLPEGVTLKDIDALLSKEGIFPAGALLKFSFKNIAKDYEFLKNTKSLEGFLFPDTYKFFLNSASEQVVRKFLDNFEKKALPLLRECRVSRQERGSPEAASIRCQELLTTASLLEKEAPDFKDRQIIAGILYKRLAAGMGLQVDATITYAKCGGAFLTCKDPKVYRKDLAFESAYNTYLYNGLPPGPIGNPGLEAIKAALSPIGSEYWYYLSDPKTKNTIFSRDLDEHLDKRAQYLGI